MALSRSFRDTVRARARRDVEFGAALVEEAIQAFLDGDADDARNLLRDGGYVYAFGRDADRTV
jgi:hypothetical protein